MLFILADKNYAAKGQKQSLIRQAPSLRQDRARVTYDVMVRFCFDEIAADF